MWVLRGWMRIFPSPRFSAPVRGPSGPPVTTALPMIPPKATEYTVEELPSRECPSKRCSSFPVSTSHNRAVLSSLPVSTLCPIWRIGYGANRGRMPFEAPQFLPRLHIPQAGCLVPAAREHPKSIREKRLRSLPKKSALRSAEAPSPSSRPTTVLYCLYYP